jgi:anti-anti-sigma factor
LVDYEITDRTGDEASIILKGELSSDVPSEQLKKALERHFIDDGVRVLRVDLSGLDWIDLEGIGVLLALWREARDRETRFVVTGASGQVKGRLEITGLKGLLENPSPG